MNNTFLECAKEASQAGAEVLKKYWGKLQSVERKSSHSDLVTIADKESEEAIIGVIKTHYPDHGILAEESGLADIPSSDFQWVIDPLDGTTNYTHCYPMNAVSIGLVHKGVVIVGVVQNPILNELFWGVRGGGSFLNGERLEVSATDELTSALLATGFAYDRQKTPETNYTEFTFFTHLTQGVRRAGSAALDLAYVAAGRLDGYWERGLQAWDMAAGSLLVEEAGGRVTAYDGSPFNLYSGRILASNTKLHEAISTELVKLKRS